MQVLKKKKKQKWNVIKLTLSLAKMSFVFFSFIFVISAHTCAFVFILNVFFLTVSQFGCTEERTSSSHDGIVVYLMTCPFYLALGKYSIY